MNSDFRELLQVLNELEVEYLVIGGYAVIHYTQPRYTKDIDLWLNPTPENADKVVKAFGEFGLPLLNATREDFANEGLMYYIGVEPCRIDFLTTIPGLNFTKAWQRKEISEENGLQVNYLSKEDLLEAKRIAGRQVDLADIEELKRV